MPNHPSRPSFHFNSICMSKAAESLRGNQPQRHSLSAQCLPRATGASSSALGESESESLYRSPMGGEGSSYSNSVENAKTHRGTVTHSWANKYHRENHDPPANWNQNMDFFPIHHGHKADSPTKSQWCSFPLLQNGYLEVWYGLWYHREKKMGWNSMGLRGALSRRQAWI